MNSEMLRLYDYNARGSVDETNANGISFDLRASGSVGL